jgi:hypothetical protein
MTPKNSEVDRLDPRVPKSLESLETGSSERDSNSGTPRGKPATPPKYAPTCVFPSSDFHNEGGGAMRSLGPAPTFLCGRNRSRLAFSITPMVKSSRDVMRASRLNSLRP